MNNAWDDFCRFRYLPLNDNIAKTILHDRDLLLEGEKFEMLISLRQIAKKMHGIVAYHYVDFNICNRMKHCKNCIPWPRPTFWRSKIWNVNISEMVRASAKMYRMTFLDFDIFYRMASLRELYNVTLIFFLKFKHLRRLLVYFKQRALT